MWWWERVWETIAFEFSDLNDPADLTQLIVRVTLAVMLAAIVGYDREHRGSDAGLRTHMLVGLGISLLIVSAQQSGMDDEAVARVVQGVISGIGFVGAGAIMKRRSKDEVRGLTTAASIWATAGITVAAGLGRELTAIVATALTYVILSSLRRIEKRMGTSSDESPPDSEAENEAQDDGARRRSGS